jgi:hypothetical protein
VIAPELKTPLIGLGPRRVNPIVPATLNAPFTPPTSTVTHPSAAKFQLTTKEFAELDNVFTKGGTDRDMGKGNNFACTLCLKRWHTREFCVDYGYDKKYGIFLITLIWGMLI